MDVFAFKKHYQDPLHTLTAQIFDVTLGKCFFHETEEKTITFTHPFR